MKLVEPSHEILTPINREQILKQIELAGRTCYRSEDKITEESASGFVTQIMESGHESVIEHPSITVRIICDRGVSHELVRHRIASYSQESTRYVCSIDKNKFDIHHKEDVMMAYQNGYTMKRISKLSNGKYTEWDVWKILDCNHIERRHHHCMGIYNHGYFNVIDTPDKAYLLGLIQADGNIRDNENQQITISQHCDTIWYIERMIRNFIWNQAHTIYERNRTKASSVSFTSSDLWRGLRSKGIRPRKSTENTNADMILMWESIPLDFKGDFLRGLLDGDGSIRFFKQNNTGQTDSCNITWNAHQHLVTLIAQWLHKYYNYSPSVLPVSGTANLYRTSITQPAVGDEVCRQLYRHFVFPYGNPPKTSRAHQRIKFNYEIAQWEDSRFQVILPMWWNRNLESGYWVWASAMDKAEQAYAKLIEFGASPQEARSVLPNSLKTEIVMTANLREWKHIFKLRTSNRAHPQMREVMIPILNDFKKALPEIYGDIDV